MDGCAEFAPRPKKKNPRYGPGFSQLRTSSVLGPSFSSRGSITGIFTFCGENGATTPSFGYKIILEHQENESTVFLIGTTHDLL